MNRFAPRKYRVFSASITHLNRDSGTAGHVEWMIYSELSALKCMYVNALPLYCAFPTSSNSNCFIIRASDSPIHKPIHTPILHTFIQRTARSAMQGSQLIVSGWELNQQPLYYHSQCIRLDSVYLRTATMAQHDRTFSRIVRRKLHRQQMIAQRHKTTFSRHHCPA